MGQLSLPRAVWIHPSTLHDLDPLNPSPPRSIPWITLHFHCILHFQTSDGSGTRDTTIGTKGTGRQGMKREEDEGTMAIWES